jgi:hypothetical protein
VSDSLPTVALTYCWPMSYICSELSVSTSYWSVSTGWRSRCANMNAPHADTHQRHDGCFPALIGLIWQPGRRKQLYLNCRRWRGLKCGHWMPLDGLPQAASLCGLAVGSQINHRREQRLISCRPPLPPLAPWPSRWSSAHRRIPRKSSGNGFTCARRPHIVTAHCGHRVRNRDVKMLPPRYQIHFKPRFLYHSEENYSINEVSAVLSPDHASLPTSCMVCPMRNLHYTSWSAWGWV